MNARKVPFGRLFLQGDPAFFVVRRCPETTGHFWFAPAQRVLLSAVLHHQDTFRLVAGISSEMLYFLFILIT